MNIKWHIHVFYWVFIFFLAPWRIVSCKRYLYQILSLQRLVFHAIPMSFLRIKKIQICLVLFKMVSQCVLKKLYECGRYKTRITDQRQVLLSRIKNAIVSPCPRSCTILFCLFCVHSCWSNKVQRDHSVCVQCHIHISLFLCEHWNHLMVLCSQMILT